jgi:uncharacterized protein YggT (Ycf19 family)
MEQQQNEREGGTAIGIVWSARALTYLVYAFVVVALVILLLGFFLLLFGANPDAPFAAWVYRGLDRVMAPFRGIFESIQLNGQSVLDTSVLFAMIVYGIAGLFLHQLIDWLSYRLVGLRSRRARAEAERRATAATQPPVAV